MCSVHHAHWLNEYMRTWLKCDIKLPNVGPWIHSLVSVGAKTKVLIDCFLERVYSYLIVKLIFLEEM